MLSMLQLNNVYGTCGLRDKLLHPLSRLLELLSELQKLHVLHVVADA